MNNDERTILTVDQAVKALPDTRMVFTFLMVPPKIEGGESRKINAPWTREEIINKFTEVGGADISGNIALRMGFGLCVLHGPGILFIQTAPGVCPLCLGEKKARKHRLHILKETCWICDGVGAILPPEKAKDVN